MKILLVLLLAFESLTSIGQQYVSSPDNRLKVSISGGNTILLSADFNGTTIINPSEIGISIRQIKSDWRIRRSFMREVDEHIYPPVAEKRKVVRDHYRELKIVFRSNTSLEVRVYNDGFAYRFVCSARDSITVDHEIANYSIPENTRFYGPPVKKREDVDIFHTSFEEPYLIKPTDSVSSDLLFFSPVLVAYASGIKTVFTESDLEDYPGMFFRFGKVNVMQGVNAPFPKGFRMNSGEFPQEVVTARTDFIARTKGSRTFPWRVFLVSEKDSDLPGNDLVYRLGAPSRVVNTEWIKAGKGTDEWIIGINLFNVPFKAGVNTATYKYYIDFAKRFGFQRIMMDAGWSQTTDLFKINPDIDMNEIAAYAKAKGVSLSMWTLASTLDRQLVPALQQFKKWGVDFIMTDFM